MPIDREQRSVAKVLIDCLSARIVEGVGAVILYVWLLNTPARERYAFWGFFV
ncbi:MAG: hypothetical protein O7G87_23580 [bacterium]|nr:hypothetical protein [bacterium]